MVNVKDNNGYPTAYLEASRAFLSPRYQRLQDSQLAGLLLGAIEQMPPMEQDAFANLSMQYAGENFFQNIGRGISQVASKALPYVAPIAQIAAPLVGTAIGGPVGGAIGGQLAGMLGKVANPTRPQPGRQPRLASPPQRLQAAPPPPPAQPAPNLNPAAAQLMALLSNPQLIQSLLGQVLGSAGNSATTVQAGNGAQTIPFGAMMNTLSELAQRASEEAIYTGSLESDNYLMDSIGAYTIEDPSNPMQRADAVMALLREDYQAQNYSDYEAESAYQPDHEDPVAEWLVSAGLVR